MIPEQAIDKAIEGGWKFPTDIDAVWWMRWEVISLEPSFWQALGEVLGWGWQPFHLCKLNNIERKGLAQHCQFCDGEGRNGLWWKDVALRFYNLVLIGGDTEKFWQEILKNDK